MRRLIILCFSTLVASVPLYEQNQHHSTEEHLGTIIPIDELELPESVNNIQELSDAEFQQIHQLSDGFSFTKDSTPSLRYFASYTTPTGAERFPVQLANYGAPPRRFQPEVVVTKNFFHHSAPEEEDEEHVEKILHVGKSHKKYNIVFIRAPAPSRTNSVLKLIPAANEDKTIVYVLSKESDADDVHAHVEELPTTTSKPEVHFIKYRTHEEATHAQENIKAEYERLGGSTHVSNEGIAPVSSVIGSLGVQKTGHEVTSTLDTAFRDISNEKTFAVASENEYLPPNHDHNSS